jgi:histidyl-tRNA synthetase
VAVIGDNEMNAGQVNLKDMQRGEQRLLNTIDLIEALK